jgi:hypothetical protein
VALIDGIHQRRLATAVSAAAVAIGESFAIVIPARDGVTPFVLVAASFGTPIIVILIIIVFQIDVVPAVPRRHFMSRLAAESSAGSVKIGIRRMRLAGCPFGGRISRGIAATAAATAALC